MSRNVRRLFAAENGASLVEYSLAMVLIGLAAVVVTSFVGGSTSDAFEEVGNAFPTDSITDSIAAPPGDDLTGEVFEELLMRLDAIDALGNSLLGKADDALDRYLASDADGAIKKLNLLINEVDVHQGNQLSYDDAASVRNAASRLVETIRTG